MFTSHHIENVTLLFSLCSFHSLDSKWRFLDDNDDDDVYDDYDAEFLKAGDVGEQVPAKYVKMLVVKCKIAKD